MRKNSNILPYKSKANYRFTTHGSTYDLPLIKVEKDKYIAWLNTLGDTKLINSSAKALAKELDGCDLLVTLEPYGIELTHALATFAKHDKFVVCRTERYDYMTKPIFEYWGPKNNTKSAVFYLDSRDARLIKGKRIGIIDEIVGARRAMNAMEKLVTRAGGKVVKRAAIFSDGIRHKDISCLDILPIFMVNRSGKE
jgi:adenine phosphoribosyltransferase